jgi:hypothetical protein
MRCFMLSLLFPLQVLNLQAKARYPWTWQDRTRISLGASRRCIRDLREEQIQPYSLPQPLHPLYQRVAGQQARPHTHSF